MAYIAKLYHKKEYRYFSHRFLYYSKKEIKDIIKRDYPDCQLLSIELMNVWL